MSNLWGLLQAVIDDAEPEFEAFGLSVKAFFLLGEVDEHPFPAELARRTHLPPPTVSYLIKGLEAKGLLERRAEPGDLRKFRLVPTEAGREALCRGWGTFSRTLGARLGRLKPGDVAAFDRIVRALIAGPDGR